MLDDDVSRQIEVHEEDEIGARRNLGRPPALTERERPRNKGATLLPRTHADQSPLETAERFRAAQDDLARQRAFVRVVQNRAVGEARHVVNANGHARSDRRAISFREHFDTRGGVDRRVGRASLAYEPRVLASGVVRGRYPAGRAGSAGEGDGRGKESRCERTKGRHRGAEHCTKRPGSELDQRDSGDVFSGGAARRTAHPYWQPIWVSSIARSSNHMIHGAVGAWYVVPPTMTSWYGFDIIEQVCPVNPIDVTSIESEKNR